MKIYLNGVDRTSTAGSHSDPASSTDNFVVGACPRDALIYMNGLIDDFAIFTTTLAFTISRNLQPPEMIAKPTFGQLVTEE